MSLDFWLSVLALAVIFGLFGILGDRPTRRDRGWHRW